MTSRGDGQDDIYLNDEDRRDYLNVSRRWSSYRATAGFIEKEKWLTVNWILLSFSRKKSEAVELYRDFVSKDKNQPKP